MVIKEEEFYALFPSFLAVYYTKTIQKIKKRENKGNWVEKAFGVRLTL